MRPIELQSADDLRHLVEKLRAATRAKTQAQLPGDPADPLRRRVEELLDDVPPPLPPCCR